MGHYRGGFAWSGDNQFNWHPLLMVLSLIYLYGNGKFPSEDNTNSVWFFAYFHEFNPSLTVCKLGILIYRSVLLPPFDQLDRNRRAQGNGTCVVLEWFGGLLCS